MPATGRPDALVHAQQAEPGELVGRVVEQTDGGREVLHVRRLDEAQTPVLAVGDATGGELELDEVAVVGGPYQHGLFAKPHALLVGVEDPVDDGAGLARRRRGSAPGPGGDRPVVSPLQHQGDTPA